MSFDCAQDERDSPTARMVRQAHHERHIITLISDTSYLQPLYHTVLDFQQALNALLSQCEKLVHAGS